MKYDNSSLLIFLESSQVCTIILNNSLSKNSKYIHGLSFLFSTTLLAKIQNTYMVCWWDKAGGNARKLVQRFLCLVQCIGPFNLWLVQCLQWIELASNPPKGVERATFWWIVWTTRKIGALHRARQYYTCWVCFIAGVFTIFISGCLSCLLFWWWVYFL